jgi:hypothetical protein
VWGYRGRPSLAEAEDKVDPLVQVRRDMRALERRAVLPDELRLLEGQGVQGMGLGVWGKC